MANSINKLQYGEIFTPNHLVSEITSLLPQSVFSDPNLKWLDPGCGQGQFIKHIYNLLMVGLNNIFPDETTRRIHIIKNMLWMIEINDEHKNELKAFFGENSNIIIDDFTGFNHDIKFDIIVGNPPYNLNGTKKVPTNTVVSKKEDGQTPWIFFVKKSLDLLKPNGYLNFIIPSLWLKPDKAKIYYLLLKYNILNLRCFSNTETNKLFTYAAQTPTCYFLLKKEPSTGYVNIYDTIPKTYIPYKHYLKFPLPMNAVSIINKLQPYCFKFGNLPFIKTNMPSKLITFHDTQKKTYNFPYVHTCTLDNLQPVLTIKWANNPDKYYKKPKIILAHKMYGFPYIDTTGELGISNRDNYVLIDNNLKTLQKISDFLSTKFALFIFEVTRYRMKYLEKYVFELLPNISNIPDFPEEINDKNISLFFGFSDAENTAIKNQYKKQYIFNPIM